MNGEVEIGLVVTTVSVSAPSAMLTQPQDSLSLQSQGKLEELVYQLFTDNCRVRLQAGLQTAALEKHSWICVGNCSLS